MSRAAADGSNLALTRIRARETLRDRQVSRIEVSDGGSSDNINKCEPTLSLLTEGFYH